MRLKQAGRWLKGRLFAWGLVGEIWVARKKDMQLSGDSKAIAVVVVGVEEGWARGD